MNKNTKRFLKKFKFIRKMHQELIGQYLEERQIGVNIDEITPLKAKQAKFNEQKVRINILVPTLRKNQVFGGISTAIKFFEALCAEGDFNKRIITTDSDVQPEDIEGYMGALIVPMEKDSKANFQIVGCNDRGMTDLNVRENDIFIATSWWSAYILKPLITWQNGTYGTKHKMIYLIQDYEPGFYPWSSRYLLADSTYGNEVPTIAVFNTSILKEYFSINGYQFDHEFYFEPVLNEALGKHLEEAKKTARKRQLIVYGRPGVDRNCFEIIVGSLRELLHICDEAREWEFLSLGEFHKEIDLGYDKRLVSKGKVTLSEYAKIMSESSVGLSLMNSPHPSYPPLEMSTFGVKTVTNTYANKDLSGFNQNLISVNHCSYENVAQALKDLVSQYSSNSETSRNESYTGKKDPFNGIIKEISELIKNIN